MSNDNVFKPGEKVVVSGQYEVIGPRGGKTGLEITAVKNGTFPPTQKQNMRFRLVDPTKHKNSL